MLNRSKCRQGCSFNNYLILSSGTLFGMLCCWTILNEQKNMTPHPHPIPHTHTHTHWSQCNKTLTLPQRLCVNDNWHRQKGTRQSLRLWLYQAEVRGYSQIISGNFQSVTNPKQCPHNQASKWIFKTPLHHTKNPTHPICLLVDGAWVMTELDWGEGRACWITMLVSWLPIREWECWCWPWPVWPCSEMFCRDEEERKVRRAYKVRNLWVVSHSSQQDVFSTQQCVTRNYPCLALGSIHSAWVSNEELYKLWSTGFF